MKITYSAFLAPENNLFELEKGDTNHPLEFYATEEDKYSVGIEYLDDLDQIDVRTIVQTISKGSKYTTVYTNSANLLATDVQFNNEWYYFKTPKIGINPSISTYDNNFVYFKTADEIEVSYTNNLGVVTYTSTIKPIPIFLPEDYIGLASIYNLDNKTYSVGKSQDLLAIKYSKPGVHVDLINRSVFEFEIKSQEFYPQIEYRPFLIKLVKGADIYEYDYSRITPTIEKYLVEDEQIFYDTIFKLFDYKRESIVDFRDNKYNAYTAFIGFKPTRVNSTSYDRELVYRVLVNGNTVYESTGVDSSVVWSSNVIKKNPPNLSYLIQNNKPALIKDSTTIKDLIPFIDEKIYKQSLPEVFYVSSNPKQLNFFNIVGQRVRYLTPGIDIGGWQESNHVFRFNVENYQDIVDPVTEQEDSSLVFDYSVNTATKNRLLVWKEAIDQTFDSRLHLKDLYLFASTDGNEYIPISKYHYDISIDNTISNLTAVVLTDILDSFNYLKIGFLKETTQILSASRIEL